MFFDLDYLQLFVCNCPMLDLSMGLVGVLLFLLLLAVSIYFGVDRFLCYLLILIVFESVL